MTDRETTTKTERRHTMKRANVATRLNFRLPPETRLSRWYKGIEYGKRMKAMAVVAQILGVKRTYASQILYGYAVVEDPEKLERLAEITGIEASRLYEPVTETAATDEADET